MHRHRAKLENPTGKCNVVVDVFLFGFRIVWLKVNKNDWKQTQS